MWLLIVGNEAKNADDHNLPCFWERGLATVNSKTDKCRLRWACSHQQLFKIHSIYDDYVRYTACRVADYYYADMQSRAYLRRGGGVQGVQTPRNFQIFCEKWRKRDRKKKKKKGCWGGGGGGYLLTYFWGWYFFEWGWDIFRGVEKFSGGWEIFVGGLRNFRVGWEIFGGGGWEIFGGGVRNFRGGGLRNFRGGGLRNFRGGGWGWEIFGGVEKFSVGGSWEIFGGWWFFGGRRVENFLGGWVEKLQGGLLLFRGWGAKFFR